jgi:hypothetical protein
MVAARLLVVPVMFIVVATVGHLLESGELTARGLAHLLLLLLLALIVLVCAALFGALLVFPVLFVVNCVLVALVGCLLVVFAFLVP